MTELAKDEPNLDNIDKEISQRFRYQEYIDSIKDLPLEVEDPVSDESSEEESDHDVAEDSGEKEADAVDVEEVEEQKPEDEKKKEVDGEEEQEEV